MMLNMKKRSQRSANLNDDDLGRELMNVGKTEAKTKNPVIAPMNLLLKSLISMKSVRYTRNQRTNVWRNVIRKKEVQILFNLMSKIKLLPLGVMTVFADKFPTVKMMMVFGPLYKIGVSEVARATVLLFFQGKTMMPRQSCSSKGNWRN